MRNTLSLFALSAGMLAAITFMRAESVSDNAAYHYLATVEGARAIPYKDGNQWCVGVGHVLRGTHKIAYTNEEVSDFFDADLANARRISRKFIKHFDDLPDDAQLVTFGLVFSCGPTGFSKWHKYIAALSKQRYKVAAQELKNSKWWGQVSKSRREDAYEKLWGE